MAHKKNYEEQSDPCSPGPCGNGQDRHTFGIAGFFETIKKFWRKALPMGLLILLIWALMLFVGLFYISSSGILATMGLGCYLASMFFLSLVEPYVWLLNRPAGKISVSLFFISFILPAVEMAPMVPRLL